MATPPHNITMLHPSEIDLKAEQRATLDRPRLRYTLTSKFFFFSMDLFYGKKLTLPKIRLIEMLARIPYQAWEIGAYWKMTFGYRDQKIRQLAEEWIALGRLSQDNEAWHLLVAVEKIREEKLPTKWIAHVALPAMMALGYAAAMRILSRLSMRKAFWFNAQFEDHAEHEYMTFVEEHPELDQQPIKSELIQPLTRCSTWGDLFRTIGLDERLHRNESLRRCGREKEVAEYLKK